MISRNVNVDVAVTGTVAATMDSKLSQLCVSIAQLRVAIAVIAT